MNKTEENNQRHERISKMWADRRKRWNAWKQEQKNKRPLTANS